MKIYQIRSVFFFFILLFVGQFFAQDVTPAESEKKETIQSDKEKNKDILRFGLESEITNLLTTFIQDKDESYADDIYEIFQNTKSVSVREKSISYFTALKDDRLSDYAIYVLEDPYDEKRSTVSLLFTYVSELELKEACPAVLALFQSENEDYFDSALSALGKVGGENEAKILIEYLDRDEFTTAQRQSLMRVLGQLKAVSVFDKLVEIVQDVDENAFVRMYAAESIGEMQKTESIDILIDLFEDTDPNIRLYALKGLGYYSTKQTDAVITQAVKDEFYKVRIEAASIAKKNDIKDSIPVLIYRAKNDPESVVKYACYDAIASINTSEGNKFLISVLSDSKQGDTAKAKAASYLLEYGHSGTDEIIAVAKETLKDDKKKTLRYALGKEIAKYKNSAFVDICAEFLAHKDVATKGTGLDIYAKNRYITLTSTVQAIADNTKEGVNATKAKKILADN